MRAALAIGLLALGHAVTAAASSTPGNVVQLPVLRPHELVDAARARDLSRVKSLLAHRGDPKQTDSDGTTALHWAARWDDVEMARALLRAGADPNAATRLGATPLYLAALNGSARMTALLLKAHADPNGPALSNRETPLMFAARAGSAESVQLLLKAGANINAAESYRGTTALMWAAERDNAGIVHLLLERGADPKAASRVHERATSGKTPTLGSLPDDPNLGKAAQVGDSAPVVSPAPPHKAAKFRDPEGGVTALILAARENALAAASALVDGGAPVNEQSGDGSTALLVAVQNAHLEMANMLLAHGADPSLANRKGWNPLYLAVKDRSMEVGTMPAPPIDRDGLFDLIKSLVQRGADVNARLKADTEMRNAIKATWLNEAGATPFLRASLCGDVAVMKFLLAHGADPKIPTFDGTTALAALAGVGFTKGFMQDLDGPEESLKALKLLIDLGIDVNAANKDKVTALHGAAHKNFVGAIQLLVDHGADLTAVSQRRGTFERSKDFKGNTVLDWAYGVQTGGESAVYHPEAVALVEKLLKERGLPLVRYETTDGGIGATVRP